MHGRQTIKMIGKREEGYHKKKKKNFDDRFKVQTLLIKFHSDQGAR